jgi:hypothetical protein
LAFSGHGASASASDVGVTALSIYCCPNLIFAGNAFPIATDDFPAQKKGVFHEESML